MKLSVYAFTTYSNDAKLYNGIRDLELQNAELYDALEWLVERADPLGPKSAEGIERAKALLAKARGEVSDAK